MIAALELIAAQKWELPGHGPAGVEFIGCAGSMGVKRGE